MDDATGRLYAPTGSIGFRWGEQGKWNLEGRDSRTLEVTTPRLSLLGGDEVAEVGFPYFGGRAPAAFNPTSHEEVIIRRVPAQRVTLKDGSTRLVATVFDLFLANYGVERGFGDAAARLRCRRALYPGLGGAGLRRPARPDHRHGAGIRHAMPKRPMASPWSSSAPR